MNLRELKIQFLHTNAITDDITVMFRTPNSSVYYDCNCHIVKYKDEDILMIDLIDKIKSTFKVGDKVTNISGLFPNVSYTIEEVNEEEQYYTYKEIDGRTYFKDQHKLKLVNIDNCKPPVGNDTNSASAVKINPNIISADELNINKDVYDTYTLIAQEVMCVIKRSAKQGKNKARFIITERDISVFQLGQEFTNAGYKVSAVIGNDKNSEINIEW